MRKTIRVSTLFVFLPALLLASTALGQDSTQTTIDSTAVQQEAVEEQVLTAISIIAVVERPSVAIVPRRDTPRFESLMFLDRNFDRELKQVPHRLITLSEDLESARKIARLKKLLVKKKN